MGYQKGMGVIDPGTATLIVAGFNTGLNVLLNRKGGRQKEIASQAVDEAQTHFDRLLFEWQSLPDKTESLKRFYLGEVIKGMDQVKRFLLNPELGEHGQRGVMERFGTYDPITGKGLRGSRWDWWGYFYDPIENMEVRDDMTGRVVDTGENERGREFPIGILAIVGLALFFVMRK